MLYRQIEKQNNNDAEIFTMLLGRYFNELNPNGLRDETIKEYSKGMINRQGDHDRHLEFCYINEDLIGFLYIKVDHEGHLGYIKPGYGYIMEFYVVPEHRRKGYGREMLLHIQEMFKRHFVDNMYLTADPVAGEPFWQAMGFTFNSELSPENGQKIYIKTVE